MTVRCQDELGLGGVVLPEVSLQNGGITFGFDAAVEDVLRMLCLLRPAFHNSL